MVNRLQILEQKHLITGLKQISLKNTPWEKAIIFEANRVSDQTIWAKTYFVEFTQDFLSSSFTQFGQEECEEFQSNLLGRNFFAEQTALRWNYYLYFVVADNEVFKDIDKDKIESDTQYARKRVVSLNKLEELLERLDYGNQNEDMPDPEGEWLAILAPQGLSGCLSIAQYSLSIQNYIENDSSIGAISTTSSQNIKEKPKDDLIPIRIEQLNMEHYRPEVFGEKRSLEFGAINLIEGDNGAGKSSIVDAVELALTGSIKRFADTKGELSGEMTSVQTYTRANKLTTFHSNGNPNIKEREQAWYNIPITREGTKIGEKFGQINRFSVESVFSLVNSQCRDQDGAIQDSISKLCFGDSIALMQKHWKSYLNQFQAAQKKYKRQLTDLNSEKNTNNNRILLVETEIKNRQIDIVQLYFDLFGEKPESDDFIKRLEDLYLRFKTEINVFSALSEVTLYAHFQSSYIQQKAAVLQLKEHMQDVENDEREFALVEQALSASDIREKELTQSLTFYSDALLETNTLHQAIKLDGISENHIASNILENRKIYDLCDTLKKKHQKFWESNAERMMISQAQIEVQSHEIKDSIANLNTMIRDYKEQEISLKEEKETIVQNLNHIQQLQAELVQHGQAIIDATNRSDCPLCGQIYDNAADLQLKIKELNQRNNLPVQTQLDSCTKKLESIQALLKSTQQQRTKLEEEKGALETLSDILQKCHLIIDMQSCNNVSDLRASIDVLGIQISDQLIRSEKIQKSIVALQNKFMSVGIQSSNTEEYAAISKQKMDTLAQELKSLQTKKTLALQNHSALEAKLIKNQNVKQSLLNAVHKEKEMATMQAAIENLLTVNVVISQETDLFSLKNNFSKLEGATKVIAENSEMNVLLSEQKKIEEKISITQKYFARCNIAVGTLSKLKDLENYSEKFIENNLQQIAVLFRKLHLPPEFTDLKRLDKELVICRPNSSQYIHINQMSMGQRTSLALAILFQMHIMGKNTPRILLLDEPVSNLDDIHIMNMVDILRELVLNGAQIFITTASSEIARYLERKFAFMQEKLVCYQFERKISDDVVGQTVIKKRTIPYLIASGE